MKQEPLLQMGISSLCMAGFPVSDRRSTGLRRTFFALKTASLWSIGTSFKMKQPRSNPRARLRCSAAPFQHICEPVTLAGSGGALGLFQFNRDSVGGLVTSILFHVRARAGDVNIVRLCASLIVKIQDHSVQNMFV